MAPCEDQRPERVAQLFDQRAARTKRLTFFSGDDVMAVATTRPRPPHELLPAASIAAQCLASVGARPAGVDRR